MNCSASFLDKNEAQKRSKENDKEVKTFVTSSRNFISCHLCVAGDRKKEEERKGFYRFILTFTC